MESLIQQVIFNFAANRKVDKPDLSESNLDLRNLSLLDPFRATMLQMPPLMTDFSKCASLVGGEDAGTLCAIGYEPSILRDISKALNFSMKFKISYEQETGYVDNNGT
jgi:hypothetical protein